MFIVSQAARRLGVCSQTIRWWDRNGHIQCHRTQGNHRRVPLSEVNRLLGKMHRNLIREQSSKKRIAIYAQVSGHRQMTDGNLVRQLKTLTKECRKHFRSNLCKISFTKDILGTCYNKPNQGESRPMNDSTRLLVLGNCDSLMDLLGRSQIDM